MVKGPRKLRRPQLNRHPRAPRETPPEALETGGGRSPRHAFPLCLRVGYHLDLDLSHPSSPQHRENVSVLVLVNPYQHLQNQRNQIRMT